MKTTRRDFLRTTSAAGALLACNALPVLRAQGAAGGGRAARKLRILVLGGTRFLGPAFVDPAIARGHEVVLFNRGRSDPGRYAELEQLRGDRDPRRDAGLSELEGRTFDAVVDTSGYFPRMVRASAEMLASAKQYLFVSTISVYAPVTEEGPDESAPVATMPDPTSESMGPGFEYYGPLKALCEDAVREVFPEGATIVRPGFIVGPGDDSHRFTYWPARVERGGEMLAPGQPSDPIQVIDVRDLGEWMLRLLEDGTTGTFNACSPRGAHTMGKVLDTSKEVTGSDASFTWVTPRFLEENRVRLPIWLPYEGESKPFHTWRAEKAVAAGLTFRPLADTVRATLDWWHAEPEEERAKTFGAALTPEREAELLARWRGEREV